jgi:hypothetical protein
MERDGAQGNRRQDQTSGDCASHAVDLIVATLPTGRCTVCPLMLHSISPIRRCP